MVNATGHFVQRLDLGRNGSDCRPMALNVRDDVGGQTEQDYYQDTEQRFAGFDEDRHRRGSGDAWSWGEGHGGVWSIEGSEGEGRTECECPFIRELN